MNENQARVVAEALGGEAWHSGVGIWLVRFARSDGSLAVISDDLVREYDSEESFRAGTASGEVQLIY